MKVSLRKYVSENIQYSDKKKRNLSPIKERELLVFMFAVLPLMMSVI